MLLIALFFNSINLERFNCFLVLRYGKMFPWVPVLGHLNCNTHFNQSYHTYIHWKFTDEKTEAYGPWMISPMSYNH